MNNKGFTLIELIITIALISMISIVVSVSIVNILNNQNDKEWDQFEKMLNDTACTYIDIKGIESAVTVSTCCLISEGYLKKVVIPGTNSEKIGESKNYNINVTFVNNEKKCELAGIDNSTSCICDFV